MYDTKKMTNQHNGILDTYSSSVGQVSGYINTTYYKKKKEKNRDVYVYIITDNTRNCL